MLKSSHDSFKSEYTLQFFNAKGETESYKISQKKYDKLGVGAVNFPALAEHKINGGYIYDIDFDMDFKNTECSPV